MDSGAPGSLRKGEEGHRAKNVFCPRAPNKLTVWGIGARRRRKIDVLPTPGKRVWAPQAPDKLHSGSVDAAKMVCRRRRRRTKICLGAVGTSKIALWRRRRQNTVEGGGGGGDIWKAICALDL